MAFKSYDLSEWLGMCALKKCHIKVALYVCPNHTDGDIHPDHSYPDTLGIPLDSTLNLCDSEPGLHVMNSCPPKAGKGNVTPSYYLIFGPSNSYSSL